MAEEITLTDEQKAAVEAPLDQPLKILAGAGTGKTTALTYRYLHLVQTHNIPPERLLALTFTRKAAAELRHRVKEALNDPKAASRAEIWNFDAFWWRLLQENPLQSGVEDDWRIVDETEKELFRDDIIRRTYRDPGFLSLFPLSAIERIDLGKILNDGYNLIPFLKGRLVDEEAVKDLLLELWNSGVSDYSASDNDRVREVILILECLYRCYQEYLYQRRLLDFGDVLIRTFRMLRDHPDLVNYYRKTFRYILVDETQDTNPAQFEILKLLAQPGQTNVTMVGDDKQSIYGFRGTSPEKFRRFEAQVKRLRENRRSPNQVLDFATNLICRDSYWQEQREDISLQNPRWGKAEQPVIFLHCAENREKEAQAVAARVQALLSDGVSPNSIALLFRSKTHMGYFEQELTRRGIPFTSVGGSYYDRPEVKDALALLKLVINPDTVGPLSRVLERPPLSFGIKELQQALVQDDTEHPEILRKVLEDLKSRLRELGALSPGMSLPELLYQAMVHTGVLAAGCMDPVDGDRIRRNCAKLLRLAMPWSEMEEENPVRYFTRLLEHRVIHGAEEDEEISGEEGVQLLTIHRAKGLEFDHVFWCDVRSPRKGTRGDVIIDMDLDDIVDGKQVLSGMGLIVKPSPKMTDESTRYAAFKTLSRDRDDEEHRLHYVAVTRAKQTLTITSSMKRGKPPEPLDAIQELLSDASHVVEDWAIPDVAEEPSMAVVKADQDSQTYWVERFRPMAASIQRRMEANTVVSEPLTLSFADLERYWECPRLLYWSLIGRKEDDRFEESPLEEEKTAAGGAVFGRIAHKLLMDLPKHPDCQHHLDIYLASEDLANLPQARSRLKQIINNYNKLGFADTQDIRTEIPWALPMTTGSGYHAVVRGIVDRIHRDNQGWVLLDYKTGRVNDQLKDSYFRQLNLYRLAAESGLFPQVVSPRIILVEIETSRIIEVPVDDGIKEQISDIIEAVFAGDFPAAKFTERCELCPFHIVNHEGVHPCNVSLYEGNYHA